MSKKYLFEIDPNQLVELMKEGVNSELQKAIAKISDLSQEKKEFLTVEETEKFFEVTKVTIHDWANKNLIKRYKMGNRTYFKRSELVETLLDSNRP